MIHCHHCNAPIHVLPSMSAQISAARLNERQRQVANALLTGASNEDIAIYCDISVKAVKHHVGVILAVFEVSSRTEFIATLLGIPSLKREVRRTGTEGP